MWAWCYAVTRYSRVVTSSRPRVLARRGILPVAVGIALLLAGCGSDSDTASTQPDASASGDSWDVVVEFNEALVAEDFNRAAELSAPESPASRYVEYRTDVQQAQQDADAVQESSGEVTGDEDAGAITASITSAEDEVTYTWTDFSTDDGLVTDWVTEQGPLADQLWTTDSSAEAGGATVALQSAYRTNVGDLYVVLEVTAGADALSADGAASYVPEGGTAVPPGAAVVPDTVGEESSAHLLYVYTGADFGGTVVYEVQNSVDAPIAARIPVS